MSISETILKEADILLKAFATGMLLIFVYDLLRIIRRLIPHGVGVIAMEDVLFWTGSAIAIFYMLYQENDGYLRGFSIGGVIAGMLLYSWIFSKYVVKISVLVVEKILHILFFPIIKLFRLLQRPYKHIRKQGQKIKVFLKKRLKKLWKAVRMSIGKR